MIKLIAQVWDRGTPDIETSRALGVLTMGELRAAQMILPQNDRRLPPRLRRVLTWVMGDPGKQITVEMLAEVADCSTATVTRLFRRHLGTSPLAWVLTARIDAAKELLVTTTMPVSKIARQVGIADASYFSRQFHAQTQLSPTAWRRRWAGP